MLKYFKFELLTKNVIGREGIVHWHYLKYLVGYKLNKYIVFYLFKLIFKYIYNWVPNYFAVKISTFFLITEYYKKIGFRFFFY